MYTQNVKPTQSQEKRIQQIFDPSYIIETSVIVSNEEKQYEIIKGLESKIDSLKSAALSKDRIISKYGNEIILLNQQIRDANNKENNVADNQLKQAKKPFLGLHLRSRLIVQEFKLERINLSLNLSYDLKKFSFGISGQSFTTPNLDNINNITYESKFYSGAFIEYKFF